MVSLISKIAKDDDGDKSDPLNQKSTIGWKAMMTAVILNSLAVMRINSAATDVAGEGDAEDVTPETVSISVTAGEHGSVSPASISVAAGSEVDITDNVLTCDGNTITATPAEGYVVDAWSGLSDGDTVSENTSVTVSFKTE